jgi:LysM repeat protein
MRVSVVAGLIVGVHVAVIGSVAMTQGCVSAQRGESSTTPTMVEAPPPPVLAPSVDVVEAIFVEPVLFPPIEPPVQPAPMKTSVAAENVYVIKSGDSLSKIAVSHGVNTRELAELNQITDPNKIRIGQKLILPDYSKPSTSQPSAKQAASAKGPSAKKTVVASGEAYVVKSGDALSKIAARYGVKTKELMAANQIKDANRIRIGQKLVIPGASAKAAAPVKEVKAPAEAAVVVIEEKIVEVVVAPLPAPVVEAPVPVVQENQEAMLDYTVQEGDTAEGIARLFVVRKDDILRVNQIPAGSDVKPGQKIKIPPSSL